MYRINLYPEYARKRADKRRRTMLAACLTVVAGLQVALIVSQALNARTAGDHVAMLMSELPRLEQMIEDEKRPTPEIEVARDLITLRRERMDWAPPLAALANAVDGSLYLSKLIGSSGEGTTAGASLHIAGETRSQNGQLETITVLMKRLREDRGFASGLATVSLGKVDSGRSGEFELTCRPGEVVR
ncbi:hypothetical protein KDK88_02700 [bacterium]|nr:hypothetical protein [bacterium]